MTTKKYALHGHSRGDSDDRQHVIIPAGDAAPTIVGSARRAELKMRDLKREHDHLEAYCYEDGDDCGEPVDFWDDIP